MAAGATLWRALFRATMIGTVLQLGMIVSGHYDARISRLFAVLGMLFSMVAGFIFGRLAAPIGRGPAAAGGLVAGAVCALIGILESYALGDVPVWVVAFGTATSAVTGGVGGWLGRLTRG